jgi:hypothetical protein
MCCHCDLEYMRDKGDEDLHNGDYVVLRRLKTPFGITEHIITFSDITIMRQIPYAYNATS